MCSFDFERNLSWLSWLSAIEPSGRVQKGMQVMDFENERVEKQGYGVGKGRGYASGEGWDG